MGSILASLVEFALQVLLGDLHIPQGPVDVFVAEQLHESRKANSEPEHFCRETVPQTVRRHMGSATGTLRSLG